MALNKKQESEIIKHISDTYNSYKNSLENYRTKLGNIYKAVNKVEGEKKADWQSNFRVNKSFQIVNQITPRVISKNPKPIVVVRTDSFYFQDIVRKNPEKIKELYEQARAIQDYINTVISRADIYQRLKLWAKNMVTYGLGFAKTDFKFEMQDNKVYWQVPNIKIKSWVDMYYDPNYKFLDDMPAIIEKEENVRLSDIFKKKDKYFNLDTLLEVVNVNRDNDPEGYREKIQAIAGVMPSEDNQGVDKNKLTLKYYYGYYNMGENPEDEKLYKFTTVDDLVLIGEEEITQFPFEIIQAFEDTDMFTPSGFVEKIMSIERELNFKKNSKADYINHALNRQYFWSPQSGVNPQHLLSRPGGIIVASKGTQQAINEVQEIPHRQLTNDYFAESNEMERDIQNLTFTVDTSNPRNQSALTNTATGARIKFFESNTVINEVRKNFEEGLERLFYKLLNVTFTNMDKNIIIEKGDGSGYWDINKEMLKDAVQKFRIKIEANSSSFDSIEDRRNDALAKANLSFQFAQAGVPMDLKQVAIDTYQTFEDKNPEKYIKEELLMPQMGAGAQVQGQEQKPGEAEQLTRQVALGNITGE